MKTKHAMTNTRHRITGRTLARHLSDNAKSTTIHIVYKKETYSVKGLVNGFFKEEDHQIFLIV